MKKLFPQAPDVPQPIANGAIRIIERYFRLHRVGKAGNLPEEARVRLTRDLRAFFDAELGGVDSSKATRRKRRGGIVERIRVWFEDFLG